MFILQILFIYIISLLINKVYFKNIKEKFKNLNNKLISNIDLYLIINLKHRKDRYKNIINNLMKYDFDKKKIVRIDAIKRNNGAKGCLLSHIKAIKYFLKSRANNVIIFEDDFIFTKNKYYINNIFNNINNLHYDVIMISHYTLNYKKTINKNIIKVLDSQTASGYILSRKFAKILLKNLQEANQKTKHKWNNKYCIDQYWKKLQPKSKWYAIVPKIAIQNSGYSDIEKEFVNYKV